MGPDQKNSQTKIGAGNRLVKTWIGTKERSCWNLDLTAESMGLVDIKLSN